LELCSAADAAYAKKRADPGQIWRAKGNVRIDDTNSLSGDGKPPALRFFGASLRDFGGLS
jgi:hypothetical protein